MSVVSMVGAWEADSSKLLARRRACLAGTERLHGRLAVLLVDVGEESEQLLASVAGQPIELYPCADPAEALLLLGRMCPDAVILGPVCGRLDPLDFLDIVRADDPDVLVIAGSGPGHPEFAARAAELGATAVVPRPYRVRELFALINSLRPAGQHVGLRPMTIDLGRLRIDGAVPQMWLDGHQISLPPMEFLVLRFLAERVGELVTRQEILDAVWGENTSTRSNTLSVHMLRLRKRFGDDDANPQWIRAIRGLGYQFNVPPPERTGPAGSTIGVTP